MRKRVLPGALLLAVVLVPLLSSSSQSRAAANPRCAFAAAACGALRPVPSLQPSATRRQWRRLVRERGTRTFAAAPNCRPLRAVFYAPSDWLRLATKLAANGSPCAQYYISIPPYAAAKTQFRTDQAWRIRALGPNFHALAEVHVPGWRAWVTVNNSTWYEAGVEARRRMAAAGYDVTLGDAWIVNEFSSAVRRGVGAARTEMRDFVHGLYDGDGTLPSTKGGVFDIGIGQGLIDPSVYKSQVEDWLQDSAFWNDMSSYVSDWSQELYGDVRNYAVAGAALATRRDYLNDYLQHQLVHAGVGGDASAATRSFLQSADSPLANAAWQWDYGFGWTMVSAAELEDYVSAQVYALRHFSALNGQAGDHWGFAWAPRNATGMPAAEFTSQTGEIIDRLAAAIRDSGQPLDPGDPGVGSCGPLGQNLWCRSEIAGAWLNDGWKTFTYWGRLALAFASPPQALSAGSPSGPIVLRTRLAGVDHSTPSTVAVSLSSSSPHGVFSTSASGPWTSTLTVVIPAGGDTASSIYYEDTTAGSPVLTASAVGTAGGTQMETVDPGPVAAVTVSPSSASLSPDGSQAFTASAADAYGNDVSVASAIWSVTPTTLGTLSSSSGAATVFEAGSRAGRGSLVANVGGISGSASIGVAVAATVPNRPPRVTAVSFGEARHTRRSGSYVTESVRFRICADSDGRLLARVDQTLRRGGHLRAKAAFLRSLGATQGACRSYKIAWRPKTKFLGVGIYTVKLRVRDSAGAWSKPFQHSRVRGRKRR